MLTSEREVECTKVEDWDEVPITALIHGHRIVLAYKASSSTFPSTIPTSLVTNHKPLTKNELQNRLDTFLYTLLLMLVPRLRRLLLFGILCGTPENASVCIKSALPPLQNSTKSVSWLDIRPLPSSQLVVV